MDMQEDKLSQVQRLKLESLAQAVAFSAMKPNKTANEVVDTAKIFETYIGGPNMRVTETGVVISGPGGEIRTNPEGLETGELADKLARAEGSESGDLLREESRGEEKGYQWGELGGVLAPAQSDDREEPSPWLELASEREARRPPQEFG